MLLLAGWLLFSWLPSKKPPTDAEVAQMMLKAATKGELVDLMGWRLNPQAYLGANLIAILLLIGGLVRTVAGATYRAYEHVACRTCGDPVVAVKDSWGSLCPLGNHRARLSSAAVIAAIVMIGALLLAVVSSISAAS